MTEPQYFVESIELLIDLTPQWWMPIEAAEREAIWRLLNTSPVGNEIIALDIGVQGIKARCAWPEGQTGEQVQEWRRSTIAAMEALPELRRTVEIHRELESERVLQRRLRRVSVPSRAAAVFGCGHERALDPTQPATLDSEERCPTCAAT